MTADVARALNAFRAFAEPRSGLGGNPFRLACSVGDPATWAEISSAWPPAKTPAELVTMWSVSREALLFKDVDYGQWGLLLLSPGDAVRRTAYERQLRPKEFRLDDVVVGKIIGDQELLVAAPLPDGHCRMLIALPLDSRRDWHVAADSLSEFLERYSAALGAKYWERQAQ